MNASGRRQLFACGAICVTLILGFRPAESRVHRGTIDQLLALDVRPFAIGHHGVGENRGENPPSRSRTPSLRSGSPSWKA